MPIVEVRPFTAEDEPAVRRVMTESLVFDAFPGFSMGDLEAEALSMLARPSAIAVAIDDGLVCGYVGTKQEDLTVHPNYRRRGHGRRLIQAGLEIVRREGKPELLLYVATTGAAEAFARAMGMTYRSSLWRFELPAAAEVAEPAFPPEFVCQALGDWLPIERYVDLMNVSFAEHPTPLSWTVDEIRFVQARGVDESGVLFVCPTDRPTEPIAFTRTVLVPPEDAGSTDPIGEVRLIGVLPEWRGRGLGRELLRWGVAHARRCGAGVVRLSVEAENERALGLYRRNGFEPLVEWPHWALPAR